MTYCVLSIDLYSATMTGKREVTVAVAIALGEWKREEKDRRAFPRGKGTLRSFLHVLPT